MSADQINDQAPEGTDEDQTPPAGGDNDQDQQPKGRQARRDEQARQRAAELETERDTLAGRVAAMQRKEAERIAGGVLSAAEDLFTVGGVALADVLDAEGNVDETEVLALAAALADSRPGLAVPRPRGHHNWGHAATSDPITRGGAGIGSEGTTWADAWENASPR